ncbi:unnamed protein product [Thlaspi arvense]|uniref:Ovate family protein n=1 Tax=Thlaspi arvense TaxID=13288 RepID=A0AAU9RGT2_THLAR|nr:unnamed protein product [Thlaspi arvense]
MTCSLVSLRQIGVRPCAAVGHGKADTNRPRSSSSSWWTPLFGWPSEPDYIDSNVKSAGETERKSGSDPVAKPGRSRFPPGCFTEEKAKQLRKMMVVSSSYQDAMYHSAIASRLASDFSDRFDQR